MHCILGTEEDNRPDPKRLMVVEWAANPLARRMPTVVGLGVNPLVRRMPTVVGWVVNPPARRKPMGEAMADDHLDLTMLMGPGDR